MAYAAYRENLGSQRVQNTTVFQVLDVTVPTLDACRVRKGIAACMGAGVLRCEPLMHGDASCGSAAPRVRLSIRMPSESYSSVIHSLLENSQDGEIGHLLSWSAHLARRSIVNGS